MSTQHPSLSTSNHIERLGGQPKASGCVSGQVGWPSGSLLNTRPSRISPNPSGLLALPHHLQSYPTARPAQQQVWDPSFVPSSGLASRPTLLSSSHPSICAAPGVTPAANFSFSARPTLSTWYVPELSQQRTQDYGGGSAPTPLNSDDDGNGSRSKTHHRTSCGQRCQSIAVGSLSSLTVLILLITLFYLWIVRRKKKGGSPEERFTRLERSVAADRPRYTKRTKVKWDGHDSNKWNAGNYRAWWEASESSSYNDVNVEKLQKVLSMQHIKSDSKSMDISHGGDIEILSGPPPALRNTLAQTEDENHFADAETSSSYSVSCASYISTVQTQKELRALAPDNGTSTRSSPRNPDDVTNPFDDDVWGPCRSDH